ncbi:hypothetical protein P43SY_007811 [Pythium insidiosum]|uniref:Actin-related protein 2/3 complex subunit 5 n=1 Tax=Pythium insidiosum TaxID=114742 RepID=A0AAD5L8R5_PYTIN|nr:hypothetical protein P43SY_007811 [Pythium insidiosum]KAJ0398284.1 hypothetical protein ATCC90586_005313 [Pythium insidiosum]
MSDDDSQLASAVAARASQVKALINQRRNEDAVKAALVDPPVLAKSDDIKNTNAQTVLSALLACNKGEMQRVIDSLTPELEDNLMKYVSKFVGLPAQSSAMLEWHQKLASKAGAGCIIRALTDRKQV